MKQFCTAHMIWMVVAMVVTAGAQPAISPDRSIMKLDELGVYLVGYAYRGQAAQQFPLGWSGFFDDRTGVACEPFGSQQGKDAFLLHSPWRGGTGTSYQQFVFNLPTQATKILVRGATAMRSENVANSDGVTFRFYANGTKLFDYHQTNDVWQAFEFDFTSLRGSDLTLKFEVDPGPNNNPAFDYSLWGGRELVLEGFSPPVLNRPAPPPLTLSNLWSGQSLDVAPLSGFAGQSTVSLSNDVVSFRYAGNDGYLEYQWRAPQSANDGLFGTITLHAQLGGDKPVEVPLANFASLTWNLAATPTGSGWIATNSGYTLWRTFRVGLSTATVRISGQMTGKTLGLTITCDQPRVTSLDAGVWGPVVRRRQVVVPYYTGSVNYLPQSGLFVNAVLDWTKSSASSHSGTKASYEALTDGSRVPLRERILFTAAWHLAEVLPNPPNPPSPWREFLANKIVLDIWGGTFNHIAANLQTLADYGITNCVALIHDWQRSGYDNALPMHYPANAAYGGDAGMSNLVASATRLGIRCALHENYVDYYPNYDFYHTNDIALDSAGKLQLAWYNPGTRIQSFAVKPNAILRLADTQSPEIHRRYVTPANYLDVHSAVPPWFHVDARAGEIGAGQFDRVWDLHRQLWEYERNVHQGPVFGEGNNHWYWSGCLDGVEAQFGSGWPGNGGFTAPLAVDFDLLKIHPLQFNHGMGYHSRWWPTESYHTNWGGPTPMIVLDRYRMQEAAFGHAGFLDSSVYDNIPLAWLEHHLMSPVMARYALAKPVDIAYESNGTWIDSTTAAKLEADTAQACVRIRYDNGLTLTVNGSSNSLQSGSWTLPEFGWIAESDNFKAGTVARNGVVTDFADTGASLFLNARSAVDWNLSAYRRIRPSIVLFQPLGTRSFHATYRWEIGDPLGINYRCFVHFGTNGVIRAQQDHVISPPTSQWQAGQVLNDGPWTVNLPSALADGDYDWLIGLFDPEGTGGRVRLQGIDDGTSRIRLGTLRLANSGKSLAFIAETNTPAFDPSAWYGQHLNHANQAVDFGDVRTDGSIWLRREGDQWRLKTWPRPRNFTLELSRARFAPPAKVQCISGSQPEVTPVVNGPWWRLPLNGASEYQWSAALPRLSIASTNDGVVLTWPASGTGFQVETAVDLAPPATWHVLTNTPLSMNGAVGITLPAAGPQQFHRLKLH
jgi:hypothetical protein